MLLEQSYLLEKLFKLLTSNSLEVEWQRRNDAIAAISQYYPILEGGLLRGRRKRVALTNGFDKEKTKITLALAKNRYSSPRPS
jgi:hypothetical protein